MKKFFLLFISLHFFQFSFSQDYYAEPFTELGYANGIREPGAIISDNYLMLYSYYYSGNGLIKIYDLSNESIDFFAEKEFLRWHPNDPAGGSNFATVNGAAFDGPDNILASGLIGYPGSTTISALRKYGTDASPQIEKICQSCFANPIIINGNYYIVLANDTADGQVMDLLSTGWTNLLRPDNKQQNFILALDNNLNERWIFDPETIYPTGNYEDTIDILKISPLANGNLLVKAGRNRWDIIPLERYVYFFEIDSQTGAYVRELQSYPPAGYTTIDTDCHLKQDPYTGDFYYNYSFNPDGQLQTPHITNMMRFDENMNLLASADWWTKTGDDFEIFENTIITKGRRRRVISKDDFTLNYTKGDVNGAGGNLSLFTNLNKSIFMLTYQYDVTLNTGAWNETTLIHNGSGRRDNNYFYEMSNIENLSSRSYALATSPILAAYNYKERISGTNNLVDTDKHISYLVFPPGFDFSQYDTFDPNVPNDTFDEAPSNWFNIPTGMTICAAPFELDENGNYFIRLITTPTGLCIAYHPNHSTGYLKVYLTTDNLTDLSVNEHNKLSFSIFPNPTANTIHIKNNSMETISKITILNSVGQKLLTQFNSDNINISSLKNGVYFIKVTFNNGSNGLSKFIKKSP